MESVVRPPSAAPVFDGEGARGWAASEIAALDTVRIAGKTDVESPCLGGQAPSHPQSCEAEVVVSNAPKDVSAPVARDTGATDETRNVGNGEFLLAVFGADLADVRPLVVSFEGDPGSGPKKRWCGLPWQSESGSISELAVYRQQLFQSRDIQAR